MEFTDKSTGKVVKGVFDKKAKREIVDLFGCEVGLVGKGDALLKCLDLNKKVDFLVSQLYMENPEHNIFLEMKKFADKGGPGGDEASFTLNVLENLRQLRKEEKKNDAPPAKS